MKNCISWSFALLLPVCCWGTGIHQARAQSAGTTVAVIDIGQVFENHLRLKAELESIKREVESFEAYVRQETGQLAKLQEQLKELNPGTENYRGVEAQMANMQANLQVRTQLKRKDVLESEARAQYNAYHEIVTVVARFCERNGIGMVIRYNSKPMDPHALGSIQAGLNRYVVYQRNLDITQHITTELNRGVAPVEQQSQLNQIPARRTQQR